MKKIQLLLPLLLFVSIKSYSQCDGLEMGTFISIDSIAGTTTIQRLGNVQLEVNEKLGVKAIQKLNWISQCNYSITNMRMLSNKGVIGNPTGNFHVKVEQINDSVFNQTVTIESHDFVHTSIIKKVSDEVSEGFKELLKEHYPNR
ncbi:hypothetical protein [Flagellimonas sp.]|uniref:hypothetical protein n=1 Tax=Flagellimonas sp. TaxID=2058762 RepID=UPI003BAFDF87